MFQSLVNACFAGYSCLEPVVVLPDCIPFDYMHQVLLGVVRTLLHNIRNSLLSREKQAIVNSRLSRLRLPYRDFSRQFRSLETLKYWKASEFKSFLFYGFITLSGCLSHDIFSHFLCLSLAIRALVEESSDVEKCVAAGKLIDTFRRNLTKYHGESSEVFNMHALSHLEEDVSIFLVTIEF